MHVALFSLFRLDNLSSELVALIQKANIVRRTGLMYKQKLEKRCSDLQKAEAEVNQKLIWFHGFML